MVITYNYTDARTGPPSNYGVTIENVDELRKAVGYLIACRLNEGESTYRLEQGLGMRPNYKRRFVP